MSKILELRIEVMEEHYGEMPVKFCDDKYINMEFTDEEYAEIVEIMSKHYFEFYRQSFLALYQYNVELCTKIDKYILENFENIVPFEERRGKYVFANFHFPKSVLPHIDWSRVRNRIIEERERNANQLDIFDFL